MKGLEIKEKMKLWSKQIEGIVGTFCVRDIPEHAYMYHTHMKNQDLINRLLHGGKKNATTFDIPMEMVAEYIRKDLMDEIERECKKSNSSKKKIKHQKEKLVRLLVILLKFEWEKSKKEVKADKILFISVASWFAYVLIVCYFIFGIKDL